MTPDLAELKRNRDALLLAEMAAWLHDMGKCSDEMIEWHALHCPKSTTFKSEDDYKTKFSNLLDGSNKTVNLLNESITIKKLVEKGIPSAIKNNRIQSLLIKYLGRCHAAPHIEKERQADKKQTIEDTRLSSPFGHETEPLQDLTQKLKALPFDKLDNRNYFLNELKKTFKTAPGDTQRPINEVDLWDWSSIVAALYKAALAGALLGNKPEPNCLRWRLLAIRFNSNRILENAKSLPVLLARKKWLSDGLDRVKKFLEEEYPLGNEVYRDENGSIFVVPDINNLLSIHASDRGNKSLKELIDYELGFEGEMVVTPLLSDNWWGQDPEYQKKEREKRFNENKDEIPPIGEILDEEPYSPPDLKTVNDWWKDATDTEICIISWLRPQGPLDRGLSRKASDYWAEKDSGRAKEWSENQDTTIWIDEVEDDNGRVCLITGNLYISDWLTPAGHVKTLLVKPPNGNLKSFASKTPSFARLRRIWETTKTFWKDVEHDFKQNIGKTEQRLVIIGDACNLPTNFAYEIDIEGIRASVFYTEKNQFIIVENLKRLALKMDFPKGQKDYIDYIKKKLTGKEVNIYNTEGKNMNTPFKISKVETKNDNYVPAIPILSEPSIFMALVPANKAFKIAKSIKEKYQKEMGKVRNRLPIRIGLTFAKSHTPLSALIDSGRRMIDAPSKEEKWILKADSEMCESDCILSFENGMTWHVPIKMGDGTTEDEWYPYFYVDGTPTDRNTAFKHSNRWLIHARELKKGDSVRVIPSTFDFEFLDAASRRFEIFYDGSGKRRDAQKVNRPYLLDVLDDFERVWKTIGRSLATTQIKNIIGLVETKREEWDISRDKEVFQKFVRDVLRNAHWKHGIPSNMEEFVQMAVSGQLRDIIELHMDIMKIKEIGDTNKGEVIE